MSITARTPLDDLAHLGERRQVPPTAAGAQFAPVTDPQHIALRVAATTGHVQRGGGPDQASIRTLNALARKGYLELVAHPGPRRANWAYGLITDAGRRELARLDRAQAEQETRRRNATPRQQDDAAALFAACRDPQTDLFDVIEAVFA